MSGHSTTPTDDSTATWDAEALAALRDDLDQLAERVADLEEHLNDTDDVEDTDGPDPRDWLDVPADHRDAAVMSALTPGETYGIADFRDLYRRETDIRASDTLRDRVKTLLQASVFERVGNNRLWRYRPPGQALDTGVAPAESD